MAKSIAIIGMSAILPGAMSITEYWGNILAGKDCITDIPDNYWDIADFYDPDPSARDKTYGFKAGVIDPVEFDSVGFGIPPAAMESISVDQLYALVAAKHALLDADLIGKKAKPFNRDKTGVILAAGIGKNAFSLSRRQDIPRTKKILLNSGVPGPLTERVIRRLRDADLEWTENSEPGYLANVTAGRIANRFDFKGINCAIDAACASGAAAFKVAVNELQSGDCDVILTGGINLDLTASAFISFCKTPAISKRGISSPFDACADGMILGDGIAMAVLKRLEDAERDNDRIYAVIKSIGSSGDGRAMSIFAPRAEGQIKAIERAFEKTDADPASVALIEAHGTGTFVGDGCELAALKQFYEGRGAKEHTIAIGSVKSQIGHTRLTAGAAGLVKAALALYHKTLPPTINIHKERPEIAGSPFYTLPSPKPWITSGKYPVRRAALSSFGFGGSNFHAILEEYAGSGGRAAPWFRVHRVPAGICLSAGGKDALISLCVSCAERLASDPAAYDSLLDEQRDFGAIPAEYHRIGFVSLDFNDAVKKLQTAVKTLANGSPNEFHIEGEGIYYRASGLPRGVQTATLFPGQGSQYLGMFNEIARDYPEMTQFLETIGSALEAIGLNPISGIIYSDEASALQDTKYTQPALAAACGGLYEILKNRGYSDDYLIGHSFGELTGLWAGGAVDAHTFAQITAARGEAMSPAGGAGGMIAVSAGREACEQRIKKYNNLYIANVNSGSQTVISGGGAEITALAAELKSAGVPCSVLNVPQAFHSPFMSTPNIRFNEALNAAEFMPLKKTLYSGADGKPYESAAAAVKHTIARQIERPVLFMRCIEDAWEKGARVFVEVGPGKVLTNLVRRILKNKEYYAVSVNGAGSGISAHVQLEEAIVQLRALGLHIKGDPYRRGASDSIKEEKAKSSYTVDPIVYMTPARKASIDAAVDTVDPPPDQRPIAEPAGNTVNNAVKYPGKVRDTSKAAKGFNDSSKGEQDMDKGALDAVLGIQSLNVQALDKFLASQGQQMGIFTELMKGCGSSLPKDFPRIMEVFQNNSMRAFDSYMQGQFRILGGAADVKPAIGSPPAEVRLFERDGSEIFTQTAPDSFDQPPFRAEQPALIETGESLVPEAAEDTQVINKPEPGSDGFDPVRAIIRIISEKTGYPEEMVDAEMNLESDLGIDSIKRIEVFSELNNQVPGGLDKDDVEAIAILHTIKEIGHYLKKKEP